jgi:chorismate lyase
VHSQPLVFLKDQKISWHRLVPCEETNLQVAPYGSPPVPQGQWKSLLCGKGSPTQHIRAITGGRLGIELIDMSETRVDGSEPSLAAKLPEPRLLRQVWGLAPGGERLFYAASWWDAARVNELLPQPARPIWENLTAIRSELHREITNIHQGTNFALEEGFELQGPFWGRDYGFWHDNSLVAVIYEVFSPALANYWQRKQPEVTPVSP